MNLLELLEKALLELVHLGSKDAMLIRHVNKAREQLGNTERKHVLCITNPEGQYADGIRVGKIYSVTRESDTTYYVGDDYARVIGHPKDCFLTVEQAVGRLES